MKKYEKIGVGEKIMMIVLRMLKGEEIGGEVKGEWKLVEENVKEKRVGME